jgi:hypothetical protein
MTQRCQCTLNPPLRLLLAWCLWCVHSGHCQPGALRVHPLCAPLLPARPSPRCHPLRRSPWSCCHPSLLQSPPLLMHALTPQRTTSPHWRSDSTLPSTSSLASMRWRKQGRCWSRNCRFTSSFLTKSSSCRSRYCRFTSSFLTKSSSCRSRWSHGSCLASSRSFFVMRWSLPLS